MNAPAPRTPTYLLGRGRTVQEFEIFLSSGSDLAQQRDLFELLADAINTQALDAGVDYRLAVRRWEDAVSRKTFGDGNREFRHDAASAHLVVVLLHEDLRPGTKEELLQAVSATQTQVAVIWMDPPPPNSRKRAVKELHATLDVLKDEVRWSRTGPPGHESVAAAMVEILSRVIMDISARQSNLPNHYFEER
ncbi:hypothetical protein [Mycobacterium sp. PSTR-4-N]|uniref:hypothetical protein n=1 Tax=Mycobacterium sp. PSTR-4-N TaxID=2917745 RepID=UPI001F14F9E1|nr:hypothetical protein [Mycobacterium sp. PSTR-4-N]MCG7595552.1 hypothetical protein [Mycobacterium sp. PSTR-4-N]